MEKLTYTKFIRKTRPTGQGHITIQGGDGKTSTITFSEVVCDLCNVEIVQYPDKIRDDGFLENPVYLDGSYAICEDCYNKSKAKEDSGAKWESEEEIYKECDRRMEENDKKLVNDGFKVLKTACFFESRGGKKSDARFSFVSLIKNASGRIFIHDTSKGGIVKDLN